VTLLGTIRGVEKDKRPALVVAPASLIENWERELAAWCPSLKCVFAESWWRFLTAPALSL
jgi:SNF2 family DNA or RNA helicase